MNMHEELFLYTN